MSRSSRTTPNLPAESQPRSILSRNGTADISTRITLTEPGSRVAVSLEEDTSVLVTRRLQEALTDANERGAQQLKLDRTFAQAILNTLEYRTKVYADLKTKFDGVKVSLLIRHPRLRSRLLIDYYAEDE